jgi:hypothetical protein
LSQKYRYAVANGIKIASMQLTKHIPSYITIDGYRALISYEGQPQTCYGFGDTEHMYHACPKRRGTKKQTETSTNTTWAQIVSTTAPIPETSNSTLRVAELVQKPTQQRYSENARIETTEQTASTHHINDEDDKTQICDRSLVPEVDPDRPVPLRRTDEPLDIEKTTKPDAGKTTTMDSGGTTQEATQTNNTAIHTPMDVMTHTDQSGTYHVNE